MNVQKLPIRTQTDGASAAPSSANVPPLPTLEPHRAVKLEGILCCSGAQPRARNLIADIVMPSLIDLVRQATAWGDAPDDEDRLGDYRFLVLSLETRTGVDAYVQIFSKPRSNLIVEVGPGNRPDPKLQAFADGIREMLADRGFQIGGNADNFRKELPSHVADGANTIAREMLSLVVNVLGFDGTSDLRCRFQQHCHLEEGHVLRGISRYGLRSMLQNWGLRPTVPSDEADVLHARNLYQSFQLQLFCPHARADDFFEIHCVAWLTLSAEKAAKLVEKVNSRPYLLKAHAVADAANVDHEVRLSHGINLAGGVTPNHIRDQIFEFVESVRKLRNEG